DDCSCTFSTCSSGSSSSGPVPSPVAAKATGPAGSGSSFFVLIQRAASIGVKVNETSSETAMAAAEVKPNDDMKRPTSPPMKPTGKKTASKLKVVAST